jgi:hypothetical protein
MFCCVADSISGSGCGVASNNEKRLRRRTSGTNVLMMRK